MRVLASAVELGELEVVDWANSREDLIYLELNATLDEVFSLFRRHKYSRYPIYDEAAGEFVGVLHIKDLYCTCHCWKCCPRPCAWPS